MLAVESRRNRLYLSLFFFIIINLSLYLWIYDFNGKILFNRFNYFYNSHHLFKDPRVDGGQFEFLRALGQYDAQWYLRIAAHGYPSHPQTQSIFDKTKMGALSYAFFPLYPAIIYLFNTALRNVELSAFVLSNILLLVNFLSLLKIVEEAYDDKLATRTAFLLFLFPFSIFYRSYFTEGIFLFLLLWFSHFFIKKKFIPAAILLGLLSITKANAILIVGFFIIYLLLLLKKRKMNLKNALVPLSLCILPFLFWLSYCFIQTGNLFYFISVRSAWMSGNILTMMFHNILLFISFPFLPVHSFHFSQIDVFFVVFFGGITLLSKKFLTGIFWWIALLLWVTPLITSDTMSFTRYQTVSFPVFIFLASRISGKYYFLISIIFYIMLLAIGLLFVNWYWIG